MSKILVTAIGSFSAYSVITSLKQNGFYIVGTDIYPKEWHIESFLCDKFYQCPPAKNEKEYISFLLDICKKDNIFFIIPLTDLEIDIINRYRDKFKKINVILGMPSEFSLNLARDKYKLFEFFANDENVPSIKTFKCPLNVSPFDFPLIAKPYNGRSSEGLKFISSENEFLTIKDNPDYIIQEIVEGQIVTVDYIRDKTSGYNFSIPRYELIRTKNGAGVSIKIFKNNQLQKLVSYIGTKLDINGCICMEFIEKCNQFFLIDVNPRFSAGIAFTQKTGNDMVLAHVMCHLDKPIKKMIPYREAFCVKSYTECITSFAK